MIPFLADSFSSIICDSNGAGFGTTAAIGSGPWKLKSWTKGDRIVLEKNATYKNFGKLAANKGAPRGRPYHYRGAGAAGAFSRTEDR